MGLGTIKKGTYLSILGDEGVITKEVSPETEGAVKRSYKDENDNEKFKYELKYGFVEGLITSVKFFSNRFGTNIIIGIKDQETFFLSVGIKSRYGRDLMHKLPNIDFSKPVKIVPYCFKDDKRKGVTIYQDDEKILSKFIVKVKDENGNEKTEYQLGYPQLNEDWTVMSDDEKDIYSANVRQFLQKYITENVLPKFENEDDQMKGAENPNEDVEEIDPDDIPF